jgi:hypothetical protein
LIGNRREFVHIKRARNDYQQAKDWRRLGGLRGRGLRQGRAIAADNITADVDYVRVNRHPAGSVTVAAQGLVLLVIIDLSGGA